MNFARKNKVMKSNPTKHLLFTEFPQHCIRYAYSAEWQGQLDLNYGTLLINLNTNLVPTKMTSKMKKCIRPISTSLHVHSVLQLTVKPERPSTDDFFKVPLTPIQTGVRVTNMAKLGDDR